MATATTMLDAALEYVSRGVPVFPTWGVALGQCLCEMRDCAGKHPIGQCAPEGFKNATTDAAMIEKWWTMFPEANIATPTTWCTVLDVDPRHGGDDTLAALEHQHGALPDTPQVLTGGGGVHYYFRPAAVPCSVGRIGAGIDVRAEGGYVLLPPSTHLSGRTYGDDLMYPLFDTPLAAMPAWLVTLANGASSPNGHAVPFKLPDTILDGERNQRLYQLGRSLHAKGSTESEILAALEAVNASRCRPPLANGEVRQVAREAARQLDRPDFASRPVTISGPPAASSIAPKIEPLTIGLGTFLAEGELEPEPEPYVEGVLSSEGSGWLAGEEKSLKTLYMCEEAACLALALPVCGRFAVRERRRVMVFEEEDTPRRIRRRVAATIRGHGLDPADPALELDRWFRVSVWKGTKLDDPVMLARIEADIAAFRPHVVYGDALRKLTTLDLNKQDQVAGLLNELDRLRRTYGCIFRLVHHSRKVAAGGFRTGRGSQEMAGSYVLGAWGESSLFFEPIGRKQGAVRVAIQSKDDAPAPPFRLIIESEGPTHAPTVLRFRAEDDAGEDADDIVLQAIAALPATVAVVGRPGVTVQALADHLKKSTKTIRRALDRLEDSGRVVVTGKASKQKDLYGVKE